MNLSSLLNEVRHKQPLVHHITNWVTIYDCAAIVKSLGASPVMSHAKEEVAEMTSRFAAALVLNIGTLTIDIIEAMLLSSQAANQKNIPVVLDACGAGATAMRTEQSWHLLKNVKISILKGNSSEIASISGAKIHTRGVDAVEVKQDLTKLARDLAQSLNLTVVITGQEDIIADQWGQLFLVNNGHPVMAKVVGTGCMATSVIGCFAAVSKDFAQAATAAMSFFGICGELAAQKSSLPGTWKQYLFDICAELSSQDFEKQAKIQVKQAIV